MKILVVQIGRYGDLILTTPLLSAIKSHIPDCELHVLVSHRNEKLQKSITHVDKFYVYKKSLLSLITILFKLRKEKYDIYIDPKDEYSAESKYLSLLVGSKKSIGFNRGNDLVFTIAIQSRYSGNDSVSSSHIAQRNVDIMRLLHHDNPKELTFALKVSQDSKDFLSNYLVSCSTERYVVINVSAGSINRYWQIEKWIEIKHFLVKNGFTVCLTSSPKDIESLKSIKLQNPKVHIFTPRDINDTVALIKNAVFIISPDSAPIHIASAFNIPVIGLFSAVDWNKNRFAPVSSLHQVVQPRGVHSDIRDITTSDVEIAVLELCERIKKQL